MSNKKPPGTNSMFGSEVLARKTIVITGGGTGLGKEMARFFSRLGANIAIASRKLDVLEKTAAEIEEETGGKVLAVVCDVRDCDHVQNLLQEVVKTFGRADILLNNAAGNFISQTKDLSSNAFSAVIDIVLKGSINCSLAFGKYWIAEKVPGNILNIVTTYASTGSAFVVPSACAKAGVLALTRSLAVEWGKYAIRCNAVAPGIFPTEGALSQLFPQQVSRQFDFESRVPLKRTGEYQDLANLAAFLISDFSGFINGEVITIDGGEWLKGAGQFNSLDIIPEEVWQSIRGKSKG